MDTGSTLKVGDIVTTLDGGPRMKVASIDTGTGDIRCTWTRGPGKCSRLFEPQQLMTAVANRHVTTAAQPPQRQRRR